MTKALTLHLEDLRFDMLIGIENIDRERPVPLSIDAWFTVNYADNITEDSIEPLISYADLRAGILDYAAKGHRNLLETFANELLEHFFNDDRIEAIRLKISKTAIFDDVARAGIDVRAQRA